MFLKILRGIMALVGALIGYQVALTGYRLLESVTIVADSAVIQYISAGIGVLVGAFIFYLLSPVLARAGLAMVQWGEGRLQRVPVDDVIAGGIGLIVGLIIANLLWLPLSRIPVVGVILPLLANLILGYLGVLVAVKRREELAAVFSALRLGRDKSISRQQGTVKILDTSVIIDGRIADICNSGFVEGTLIIPGFVLEELRHIADSSDLLKRNRGRRGLDILNRMQKELELKVQILNRDFEDTPEVDSKLVRLAKELNGKVFTNDFNLNKVAELQGVSVLNINELANAVKPAVLPGEEMQVAVIKEGKESGQGVGYLDDGTMVVVDGGKRHIGDSLEVLVTSVLQTAAGRMIFAKPKGVEKAL